MKKRALILAMIAFITATTSEPAVNTVYAEETQTEESAGQASELPVKALTPKAMDVNPYMAASDSNIHHDCYNTDSTDEVLPVDIYSEINVSYEKVNPMLPRQSFLIPMDILWFRFWVAWRSVILMQMRHRPWLFFTKTA